MVHAESKKKETRTVPVGELKVCKFQPRKKFALRELAESIAVRGIIKNIMARELPDGTLELLDGERRLRSAKHLGLLEVPVDVYVGISDSEAADWSMQLNIDDDSNRSFTDYEMAIFYQMYIDEFDATQDEVAARYGKTRSAVMTLLNMLKMPFQVQRYCEDEMLGQAHCQVLQGLEPDEQIFYANEAVSKSLSKRKLKALVDGVKKKKKTTTAKNKDIEVFERALSEHVGLEIKIDPKKKQMVVSYNDNDELEGACEKWGFRFES